MASYFPICILALLVFGSLCDAELFNKPKSMSDPIPIGDGSSMRYSVDIDEEPHQWQPQGQEQQQEEQEGQLQKQQKDRTPEVDPATIIPNELPAHVQQTVTPAATAEAPLAFQTHIGKYCYQQPINATSANYTCVWTAFYSNGQSKTVSKSVIVRNNLGSWVWPYYAAYGSASSSASAGAGGASSSAAAGGSSSSSAAGGASSAASAAATGGLYAHPGYYKVYRRVTKKCC